MKTTFKQYVHKYSAAQVLSEVDLNEDFVFTGEVDAELLSAVASPEDLKAALVSVKAALTADYTKKVGVLNGQIAAVDTAVLDTPKVP